MKTRVAFWQSGCQLEEQVPLVQRLQEVAVGRVGEDGTGALPHSWLLVVVEQKDSRPMRLQDLSASS